MEVWIHIVSLVAISLVNIIIDPWCIGRRPCFKSVYSEHGYAFLTDDTYCWAQSHFGEKARRGGETVGRKACEACMQEEGKERKMAEKKLKKVCMQRRKVHKANMQEYLSRLWFW
jgi:hypothetical protein